MKLNSVWAPLSASGLAVNAWAHPGHDMMAHGAAHVATSPYHLAILATATIVAGALGFLVRNARAQRVFKTAALCLACATVVLAVSR